ncbi:hypothetical protein Q9Q95_05060 [Sphingomonas sp. DG1-23]|uniref:hypothetical protein n=1 Tax=Sphingomonas sp. DG1-23 TaxID=3068316 RepID=UPI00273E75D0|nr:hypothetical protein [Sphingomonas sp. DG1-23]MDP5278286.1 hypothetical protein [Sphingomonas sp. DG1-23]
MENPRTDAARANDDSDLIEGSETTGEPTSSGGNLARDVASQAEEALINDPEERARVNKDDDIAHGTEVRPDRASRGRLKRNAGFRGARLIPRSGHERFRL